MGEEGEETPLMQQQQQSKKTTKTNTEPRAKTAIPRIVNITNWITPYEKNYPLHRLEHKKHRKCVFVSFSILFLCLMVLTGFVWYTSHSSHYAEYKNNKNIIYAQGRIDMLNNINNQLRTTQGPPAVATATATAASKQGGTTSQLLSQQQELKQQPTIAASSGSDHETDTTCEATILLMRHCEKYGPMIHDEVHRHNQHCSYLGKERSYFIANELFGDVAAKNNSNTYYPLYPVPTQLYAYTAERRRRSGRKKYNYREIETIQPLAEKYNKDIAIFESTKELANHYFQFLQQHNNDLHYNDNQRRKLRKKDKKNINNNIDDKNDNVDGNTPPPPPPPPAITAPLSSSPPASSVCGTLTIVSWKHELFHDLALQLGCSTNDGCPDKYPQNTFDEMWELKYKFVDINTTTTITTPVDNDKNDDTTTAETINNNDNDDHDDQQQKQAQWKITARIMLQNFDPLQYSTMTGDYPQGGKNSGGNWMIFHG